MKTHFDQLLDFPTFQTFKIMGETHEALASDVLARLQQLAPGDYAPKVRPSSKGNYSSVSVSVRVTSKEHMELIYTELAKVPRVRYVL